MFAKLKSQWGACINFGRTANDTNRQACRNDILAASQADMDSVSSIAYSLNNVLKFGAKGNDPNFDNYAPFAAALAVGSIYIPEGVYNFKNNAFPPIPSNTQIEAHRFAYMKRYNNTLQVGQQGLLCNANPNTGDKNIYIRGGIWDFNVGAGHANNPRTDTPYGCQAGFRFKRVQNLIIRDLVVKNPSRFCILLTLCTNGLLKDLVSDHDYFVENDDLVHATGCQRMTVDGLRAERTYDDAICYQTGDTPLWMYGSDGHGPSLNNTGRNIHITHGRSAFRNMSMDNELSDGILFENISGMYDGIVGWLADSVGNPNPNYGSLTVRNVTAGRDDTYSPTGQPMFSATASIKNLLIDNIQRSEADVKVVPMIALGDQYGGKFGRVMISNLQETGTARRTVIDLATQFESVTISNCSINQPFSGDPSGFVFLFANAKVDRMKLDNIYGNGLDTLVNHTNNNETDIVFTNCHLDHGYVMNSVTNGSKCTLSASNCTVGPAIVISMFWCSASQIILADINGCRAPGGGVLMKFEGVGTGPSRISGEGNQGSLSIIGTNAVSVKSFSINATLTDLTPLAGDFVQDPIGQCYNYYSAGWHAM